MAAAAALAAALTGLALVGPILPPLAAAPEHEVAGGGAVTAAAGPVEEAREAVRRVPFSARVEVSWVDHDGLHTAEMGVRTVGGEVRIQGPAGASGAGATTVLRDHSALTGAGQEAAGLLTPALKRKYDVTRGSGPEVAGRRTEELVLSSAGRIRERLAIDRATGLVLQREVFDDRGRPVRVVRVLQLDTAPVPRGPSAGSSREGGPRPLQLSRLPSAYPAPAVLAGGYQRVAAYRHSRLVHLLYTDGLHGLSLFSQPGELSVRSLPRGGERVLVDGSTGVRYTWPGGEIVTWQAGPMVHTLVGDATAEDLVAAARSLPRPGGRSLLARALGTARAISELVSGGR